MCLRSRLCGCANCCADGVKLINVLEELCKTKLPSYDLKPRVQIQKVQNLNIALNFIKQQGIKLIGVDAQVCSIVDEF